MTAPSFLISLDLAAANRERRPVRANTLEEGIEMVAGDVDMEENIRLMKPY